MKNDFFALFAAVITVVVMIMTCYFELYEVFIIALGLSVAWIIGTTLDIRDDLQKIKRGQLLHKDKLVRFSNRVPDEHKRILIYANIEYYMCWTFTVTRRGNRYYRDLDDLEIKIPLHHYWIYLKDL